MCNTPAFYTVRRNMQVTSCRKQYESACQMFKCIVPERYLFTIVSIYCFSYCFTRCNFPCNFQRNSTLKRCKFVTNVWYVKNILANSDGNLYLPILHLPRVELNCIASCKKNCTVRHSLALRRCRSVNRKALPFCKSSITFSGQ